MSTELNTLKRALRLSEGQFSLLLARCAYRPLRETLEHQLSADSPSRCVSVPADTHNLLELLQAAIADEKNPPALLVSGLEQVDNLAALFAATNQLRDEFPRLLPCPLVLWVTDSVLQCLIRVAPDFESWGTSLAFDWDDAHLLAFIEQKVDTLLQEWLNPHIVLPSVPQVARYDASQLEEFQTAQQSLQERGVALSSKVRASLDLLRACDTQAGSLAAQQAYEASIDGWQQSAGTVLQQAVCWVLLAYNGQIMALQHPQQRENAWAQAVDCWQRALDLFKHVEREDLYAKFINGLGQVYWLQLRVASGSQQAAMVQNLEKLAQTAVSLHQKQPRRLSQAQALLAEVAWQRHLSIQVPDTLFTLGDSRDRAWFSLLQALHLGNTERALQHLEVGLQFITPQRDAYLYLRLLKHARQVHFELGDYLAAFRIKLRQYDVEQQCDLRAFNGAGRLRAGINWEDSLSVSGRNQDVQNLLARMGRDDQALTIVYGPSGVGKSSLIQAGLVSALKRVRVHARPLLPVLQTVYTDWALVLQQNLDSAQDLPARHSLRHESLAQRLKSIIAQLRHLIASNYLTVLIFEQFEEFFFACKEAEQRKVFYDFLQVCLDLPEVKVMLALREDYLHHLLECNERLVELPAINNNILDKKILYYLGNFSREQAKTVILSLTDNTPFQLEADLIEVLLDDFAEDGDGVRPIELQVVGNQLQHENIRDLATYRARGPKTALVERYVQTVVEDCGAKHERLATLVLYLLTDEDNTRPLKTRAELQDILEPDEKALELVLAILTQSRLMFVHPGDPAPYYQLVHDYLVPFIRRQQSADLQAQLESEQRQRRYSEAELKRVLLRQRWRDYRILGLIALLCVGAVTWVMQAETAAKAKVQALTIKRLWNSQQQLDALVVGLQQTQLLNTWQGRLLPSHERHAAILSFQEVMQGITERNRLDAHRRRVLNVSYSADGRLIASTGDDGRTLIWNTHGKQLAQLEHVRAYRPDGPLREAEQKTYELPIWSAAFHPNGRQLAVAVNLLRRQQPQQGSDYASDYAIELWTLNCTPRHPSAQTCRNDLKGILSGHQGMIYNVSFSPNGHWLASAADDHSIRLWTPDGDFERLFSGHTAPVHRVVFSPDSQTLLSASDDKTLRLWSLDGEQRQVLRGHEDWVLNAAFSPDGRYIASVGRDGVRLWQFNSADGGYTQLHPATSRATRHEDYVWGCAFSADGRWLATAGLDKVIKIWQFQPQQQPPLQLVNTLPGHQRGVLSLAFNPQQPTQLASAGLDKRVRLWRVEPVRYTLLRGSESYAGKADEPTFSHLAFSPDNELLASGSQEGEIILWDQRGRRYARLRQPHTEVGRIKRSVSAAGDLRQPHTPAGDEWAEVGRIKQSVSAAGDLRQPHTPAGDEWAEVGRIKQSVSAAGDLRQPHTPAGDEWAENSPVPPHNKAHQAAISALQFSPDGQFLLSGDNRGQLYLWDRQGRLTKKLAGHTARIRDLSFSPDGEVILSSGLDGKIRIWHGDGELMDELPGYAAAFSPSGQYIAVAPWSGLIRLLYLNGTEAYTLSDQTRNNTQIRFSPDGKLLFSASWQGDIHIWGNQGQHIAHVQREASSGHLQNEQAADFSISPDSQIFAIGSSSGKVQLWSIAGTLMNTLQAHQAAVTQVRFSPDGQWLATAAADHSIALWQRNGRLLARFTEHEDSLLDLRFSPDGRLLASSSADKTVRLWSLDFALDKLRQQGCAWGRDYLASSQTVWDADRGVCE